MGETGPCGPCSEIHYYLGENPEDPAFNRREYVNGTGDETVEIWNLVFMQYNRKPAGDGNSTTYLLEELPAPSVDTGAGLERLTAVLQGVTSTFETDLIKPVIDFTAELLGKHYVFDESDASVSYRVIADHARATAMLIADGIFPGNDRRGYVLRKIIRRAIWHGSRLGFTGLFYNLVTNRVVDLMGDVYPELREARSVIDRVVTIEEQLYASTVAAGLNLLDTVMKKSSSASTKLISGADIFKLYDTYGLRVDLIEYVAAQRGVGLDLDGFEGELEKQRQRARESWKGGAAKQVSPVYRVSRCAFDERIYRLCCDQLSNEPNRCAAQKRWSGGRAWRRGAGRSDPRSHTFLCRIRRADWRYRRSRIGWLARAGARYSITSQWTDRS